MKKLVFVIIVILFIKEATFAQLPPVQQKAIVIKRMAELKHYAPRPVDDSFSASLFQLILEEADPRRLLFTAAEYQQLQAFRISLDDELQGNSWNFYEKFSSLYKKALVRADSIINRVLAKPFDYMAAETLGQSKKTADFNFSTDIAALTNRWSRYLKFLILNEVYDVVSTTDSAKKVPFKTGLTNLEPATRERVKKAELKAIKNIMEHPSGFAAIVTELYLNAIASCFDPHTNYFSPEGKEDLQAELSTEAYFFGIVFSDDEKGKITIDKLTPGGAAWKSGEINKGDELVSLLWEGKEVQDMTGATLEEVYEVLDQSNHDKMIFRLRKADGTISNVMLRKEKADNEENIVKSFVLKGEKKIGYVLLPGFYTEWENETGSSCANDVAKEILKLKKENIDGLILDVRYNGGGSLGEAMDMIGIFIDEGPLAAEKGKDGKLLTLKDPNRGTIYDGPLTLMVNGQSASASEVLAASLQDYNRAVIVGSTTYGKATMQELFPMDTNSKKTITGNEKGDMIKITTGKLYRVNGSTAQLKGVVPDVVFPGAFDGLEIGERFQKFPLIADSVKRNSYYKPLPYLPVSELANRSTGRINAHPDFQVIKKIVEEQQRMMQANTITIPLKADLFEKWIKQQELDLEAMKGEGKPSTAFVVENHTSDRQLMVNNQYAKEINNAWLKNLADDIYIQEAFLVVTDLINLQKTAAKN
ncbi:MAG: carboxy terminal-processing peptidase [Chitinophagaceae bacterium]|nr:carboxy terminal-processing peptidase [Chitinophagaceae bacterium]